jgi:hypothetical protein
MSLDAAFEIPRVGPRALVASFSQVAPQLPLPFVVDACPTPREMH